MQTWCYCCCCVCTHSVPAKWLKTHLHGVRDIRGISLFTQILSSFPSNPGIYSGLYSIRHEFAPNKQSDSDQLSSAHFALWHSLNWNFHIDQTICLKQAHFRPKINTKFPANSIVFEPIFNNHRIHSFISNIKRTVCRIQPKRYLIHLIFDWWNVCDCAMHWDKMLNFESMWTNYSEIIRKMTTMMMMMIKNRTMKWNTVIIYCVYDWRTNSLNVSALEMAERGTVGGWTTVRC